MVDEEMIEKTLGEMLKKDVQIFLKEYRKFLSSEQIETLERINYQKIIKLDNLDYPFGKVFLGTIYLSNTGEELIHRLSNMDNYNTSRYLLKNNNLSSYLKYMCENGYSLLEYFGDMLMYFVFKLVIKDNSSLINGLINQEIEYLSIKYSIRCVNLYAREEKIVAKITPIFKLDKLRKMLFMDKVTRFKFLSENMGYRYANLVNDIEILMNNESERVSNQSYQGLQGFLDYANAYDKIGYGNVYNYLLDFQVENSLNR